MTSPRQISGRFTHNVGGGIQETVSVAPGTTVEAYIDLRLGTDFDPADNTVRFNGATCADLDQLLTDGFRLSVTPNKADNGVQMPSIQDLEGWLTEMKATFLGPGPGDHEKWCLHNGKTIQVNPGRKKSEVDIATIRSLAKKLGLEFGKVLNAIQCNAPIS